MLKMIVAVNNKFVIGNDNELVWYSKEDLLLFKEKTLNSSVIMGKNTMIGLPKFPLPNRANVILTSDPLEDDPQNNTYYSYNPYLALEKAHEYSKNGDVWVIGGAQVYKHYLPFVDEVHISYVNNNADGNKRFPILDFDRLHFSVRSEEKISDLVNVVVYSR